MERALLEKLKSIGVDTDSALNRFAGNNKLYEKFLFKFLEDKNFSQMTEALDCGDYEAALVAAHTLKGVAGNLGMQKIFETCGVIVGALRGGQQEAAEPARRYIENYYKEVFLIIEGQKEMD